MTEKERSKTFFILNILLIMFVGVLESSLWYWAFEPIPNPMIWLSIVVAAILYRSRLEGLLIIYLPSLFYFTLSAEPLGFILFSLTCVFIYINLLKNRIFIPGKIYFSGVFSSSILIFQIALYIISIITEVKPHSTPQVWKWISQALLGFAISPLYYPLLEKLNPPDESLHEQKGAL